MDTQGHNPDLNETYLTLGRALAEVLPPGLLMMDGRVPEVGDSRVWNDTSAYALAGVQTAPESCEPGLRENNDTRMPEDGAESVFAEASGFAALQPDEAEGGSIEDIATEEDFVLPSLEELAGMSADELAGVEAIVHRRMRKAIAGGPDMVTSGEPYWDEDASLWTDGRNPRALKPILEAAATSTENARSEAETSSEEPMDDKAVVQTALERRRRLKRRGRAAKAAVGRGVTRTVAAMEELSAPALITTKDGPADALEIAHEDTAERPATLAAGGEPEGSGQAGKQIDVDEIPFVAAAIRFAGRIPHPGKSDPAAKTPSDSATIAVTDCRSRGERLRRLLTSKPGIIGLAVILAAGAGLGSHTEHMPWSNNKTEAAAGKPAPPLERLREMGVPSTPAGKWVPGEVSRFNEVISKIQNDQALAGYLESKGWQPWFIEPRLVQACVLVLSGGDLNHKAEDGRSGLTLVDETWAREQMADFNPQDPSHSLFVFMLKLNQRFVAAFETGDFTKPEDRKKLIRAALTAELKDIDPLDNNKERLALLARWVPELDGQWLADESPAFTQFNAAKAKK